MRESDEDLASRAGQFLQWLMARPEQHIAVVTHSSWLSIMFKHFAGPNAPESMTRWFENAEMRSVVLHAPGADASSPGSLGLDFVPSASVGLPMHATISTRSAPESSIEDELAVTAAPAGA